MRNNNLIWILVLGGVAYWLFFRKQQSSDETGGGSFKDNLKPHDDYDVADKTAKTMAESSNFAGAGNPDGLSVVELPVYSSEVSFL